MTNMPKPTRTRLLTTKKDVLKAVRECMKNIAAERDKLQNIYYDAENVLNDSDSALEDLERAVETLSGQL